MQKSRQSSSPPRSSKARKGGGDAKGSSNSRAGSPDWALEQQQGAGNQTVLGMIGGTRDNAEIAGGRPIGRMVEWVPKRGGEMKCRAVFPPGTEVNVGDVGTIADKWGYRVERWEEINDNIHIEFVTMAPEDQFAWGAEVILGAAPPETILEEVQQDEADGKGLLAAASGLVAATLLAPPTQQVPGAVTAQPAMGLPGMGTSTAAPAAAGSTGLAASMVAMALGTPSPTQAAPGATPAMGAGMGMGTATPGLAPAVPGLAPTAPQKAGLLDAALGGGKAPADTKGASPDQVLQQNAAAFNKVLNSSSPDLGALQRIATSVQGTRLFELIGRDASERQIENLVRAGQANNPSLLGLLEDKLYPQLGGSAQAAWDSVVDEATVEQAAKAPAPASDSGAAPSKG